MSFLVSESISDIIDIKSLEGDSGSGILGHITINKKEYAIDGFISDKKVMRVHALGESSDAISMLNMGEGAQAKIVLGDDDFVAKGPIAQTGYEILPHGGRIIISVIVRDK